MALLLVVANCVTAAVVLWIGPDAPPQRRHCSQPPRWHSPSRTDPSPDDTDTSGRAGLRSGIIGGGADWNRTTAFWMLIGVGLPALWCSRSRISTVEDFHQGLRRGLPRRHAQCARCADWSECCRAGDLRHVRGCRPVRGRLDRLHSRIRLLFGGSIILIIRTLTVVAPNVVVALLGWPLAAAAVAVLFPTLLILVSAAVERRSPPTLTVSTTADLGFLLSAVFGGTLADKTSLRCAFVGVAALALVFIPGAPTVVTRAADLPQRPIRPLISAAMA